MPPDPVTGEAMEPREKVVEGGNTEPVVVHPGDQIGITVTLPATSAGHSVTLDPVDGGTILESGQEFIVANDGTVSFTFQAGEGPGLYQIALRDDGNEIGLQLWVEGLSDPAPAPFATPEPR